MSVARAAVADFDLRALYEALDGQRRERQLTWKSFVPGMADPRSPCFAQPDLTSGQVLRWDKRALYAALDEQRRTRFPRVMRLVQYLDEPAASFTHVANC